METEPSVLIRPLIATLTQGVSRSRAETDVLQLSRQLCGVLDSLHLGRPGMSALSRWGWGSAKPRPKRQDLLAGRSADHDTLERCHG